jgi:hemolysin activation/secretion protein
MYGEAGYAMILNRTGTSLTVSGGLTTSGATAGLFGLQTEGEIARGSLLLSHPFVRGRGFSLWGNLGFEARNLHGEQFGITTYDERLRILSGSLNLRHNAWGGTSAIYAEASRGLGSLGASVGGDTRPSRIDARSDFLKAELQVSRYQDIGETFGLYVAASGQISGDPLPASEEFAIGGAQFGRAYDYWAISGDHGMGGLVELRHGKDPGLPFLKFYQVYAYYDKGWVWNQNVAPQFREASVASTGLGIRLTLPGSFYVTFESSLPVSQSRYAQTNNAWRNFFSISTSF